MHRLLSTIILVVFITTVSLHAEKVIMERTIEKTWTGFAVDEKGTIIKYSTNIVDGKLQSVSYIYRYGKNGKKQIDWSGVITTGVDFDADVADCQILALARKNVLLLFTKKDSSQYFASGKISKKQMKIRATKDALAGETCWLNKDRIYSLTASGDQTNLVTYSLKFKEKLESKRVIGIGVITAINPNIQKFYQDVSGGPLGTSDVHVRIVKP